jgi:hypothetical protein
MTVRSRHPLPGAPTPGSGVSYPVAARRLVRRRWSTPGFADGVCGTPRRPLAPLLIEP